MKQKQTKKLSLHKKAIGKLDMAAMQQVRGGAVAAITGGCTFPTAYCWVTVTVTCAPLTQGCVSFGYICNPLTLVCKA
jgi:hypothetical protein